MGLDLREAMIMGVLVQAVVFVAIILQCQGVWGRKEDVVVKFGCKAPLVVMGASMVDAGENAILEPFTSAAEFVPYGVDYFGKPAARYSNGRVISDFISLGLGYGLMEPYLDSINPEFANGVNFASSGSTARNNMSGKASTNLGGGLMFPFDVQVNQYKLFKDRVAAVQAKHRNTLDHLPTAMRLKKAIHVIMTGQNDYAKTIFSSTNYDPLTVVTSVVAAIESSLREMYKMGARTMIVMNVFGVGCTPAYLSYGVSHSQALDNDSCIASYNSLVELHNTHLQKLINRLRVELSWNELVVFDLYAMYLDAVRHPSKYGVKYPMTACCGGGGGKYNLDVYCGKTETIKGVVVTGARCENPTEYISWDGLHPTESFAKEIAYALLSGNYFSPSLSMEDACKP